MTRTITHSTGTPGKKIRTEIEDPIEAIMCDSNSSELFLALKKPCSIAKKEVLDDLNQQIKNIEDNKQTVIKFKHSDINVLAFVAIHCIAKKIPPEKLKLKFVGDISAVNEELLVSLIGNETANNEYGSPQEFYKSVLSFYDRLATNTPLADDEQWNKNDALKMLERKMLDKLIENFQSNNQQKQLIIKSDDRAFIGRAIKYCEARNVDITDISIQHKTGVRKKISKKLSNSKLTSALHFLENYQQANEAYFATAVDATCWRWTPDPTNFREIYENHCMQLLLEDMIANNRWEIRVPDYYDGQFLMFAAVFCKAHDIPASRLGKANKRLIPDFNKANFFFGKVEDKAPGIFYTLADVQPESPMDQEEFGLYKYNMYYCNGWLPDEQMEWQRKHDHAFIKAGYALHMIDSDISHLQSDCFTQFTEISQYAQSIALTEELKSAVVSEPQKDYYIEKMKEIDEQVTKLHEASDEIQIFESDDINVLVLYALHCYNNKISPLKYCLRYTGDESLLSKGEYKLLRLINHCNNAEEYSYKFNDNSSEDFLLGLMNKNFQQSLDIGTMSKAQYSEVYVLLNNDKDSLLYPLLTEVLTFSALGFYKNLDPTFKWQTEENSMLTQGYSVQLCAQEPDDLVRLQKQKLLQLYFECVGNLQLSQLSSVSTHSSSSENGSEHLLDKSDEGLAIEFSPAMSDESLAQDDARAKYSLTTDTHAEGAARSSSSQDSQATLLSKKSPLFPGIDFAADKHSAEDKAAENPKEVKSQVQSVRNR